jgi:hypothetical protein
VLKKSSKDVFSVAALLKKVVFSWINDELWRGYRLGLALYSAEKGYPLR